jgi:hypothetical protein
MGKYRPLQPVTTQPDTPHEDEAPSLMSGAIQFDSLKNRARALGRDAVGLVFAQVQGD